jgi:hypothetical protein
MDRCPKQSGWFSYFKENMEALGLPVPTSLYGGQTMVTGALASLVGVQSRFGSTVTVGELLKAGTKADALVVVAGVSASWYLGGAVGSAAVATGRHLACGTRMIDAISYAGRNGMLTPAIQHQLVAHPEIYDTTRRNRSLYGLLARAA